MSSFARGRPSRGGARGRGAIRGAIGGRGRGRGQGSSAPRNGAKSTFYSTRVEEEPGSDDDEQVAEQISERKDGEGVSEELSSASDDEGDVLPAVQPYNSLLHSLNANIQRRPPQRKKRRIVHEEPQGQDDEIEDEPDKSDGSIESASDANEEDESSGDEEAVGGTGNKPDPFSLRIADVDEALLEHNIKTLKQGRYSAAKTTLPSKLSCLSKTPDRFESSQDASSASTLRLKDIALKQKLKGTASDVLSQLKLIPREIASTLFDYKDILLPERTPSIAHDLRKLSCIHMLNHIYKTRDRVLKNNARLARESEEDVEYRDQGFTRPKVLVVVPTRSSCAKYVDLLTTLFQPEQQENKKRFQDSYAQDGEDISPEKPEDFKELFAGNDDDMFRLGIKFTRKTIKYFSQFYSSDVIFASPLGLRMAIGAEGDKKQDYDFLSSIEILIVDQADALNMQNWEHVEYMFEHLNLQPKEAHGCDFSRVRSWYLDGNSKYLRQTMVFSAFNFPALNRLFLNNMLNVAGKAKYSSPQEGAMLELGLSVKQTFSRFEYTSLASEPDARFNYFTTAIVPILSKQSDASIGGRKGVLVYLPTYSDFVRVRNYLSTSSTTQHISFGSISEYTPVREVARARSHFFTGRHSVLLYTERAHHFRRYHIRGVKRVIMYGLPENPIFYKEVAGGFLGSTIAEAKINAGEASVRNLFSRLDVLKLERIVGTKRIPLLLKEKGGDTFEFI